MIPKNIHADTGNQMSRGSKSPLPTKAGSKRNAAWDRDFVEATIPIAEGLAAA